LPERWFSRPRGLDQIRLYRTGIRPYEPYKQIDYNPHTSNGQNVKHPAQGVIARGHLNGGWPYGQAPLTDGTAWLAGYEASDTEIQLPDSLNLSGEALAEGKRVYEVFCDHCHGAKGMGDGPISKDEKIIVPSYMNADRMALSYGKMYYSITYGKNAMGQHASQLTPLERWRLVQYVRHLQGRAPEADFQPGQAAAPTMTGDAMAAN